VLFWHLVAQAVMVGSGALAVAGSFADWSSNDWSSAGWRFIAAAFVTSTVVHLLMLAVEYGGKHASRQAATAAHVITSGRYARTFWLGAVLPTVLAGLLGAVAWGAISSGFAAGLLVLAGLVVQPALIAYESVFVRAGQDMPLS
jgi:hypothetical protein